MRAIRTLTLITSFLLLGGVACGPAGSGQYHPASESFPTQPQGSVQNGLPVYSLSGLSQQQWNAVRGNYRSTFYKEDLNTSNYDFKQQSAQINMVEGKLEGTSFPLIRVDSTGSIGTIRFEAWAYYVGLDQDYDYSGNQLYIYTFHSSAIAPEALVDWLTHFSDERTGFLQGNSGAWVLELKTAFSQATGASSVTFNPEFSSARLINCQGSNCQYYNSTGSSGVEGILNFQLTR